MQILLVDRNRLVREMLVSACAGFFPQSKISCADGGEAAIAVATQVQSDVIVLEMSLLEGEGASLVSQLREVVPHAKFVGMSLIVKEYTLYSIDRLKLDGFVDIREQPPDALMAAVKRAVEGESCFPPRIERLREVVKNDPFSFDKILSNREMQLLSYFGEGLTNESIGALLKLQVSTVRNHRQNILDKLNLTSTPQLMRYALRTGLCRG